MSGTCQNCTRQRKMDADERVIRGPPLNDLPTISVGQFVLDRLLAHGTKTIQVDARTDRSMSYNEVLKMSIKIANGLRKRGIKIGDKVTFCCENHFYYFATSAAVFYLGAVLNPLNPDYTEGEIRHALNISKPRLIFVSRRTERLISEVVSSLPEKVEMIELDDEGLSASVPTLESMLKEESDIPDPSRYVVATIPDTSRQEAVILLSSGTTGLPKGVALSHRNLMLTSCMFSGSQYMDLRENDRLLHILPFFHGYGYTLWLLSIAAGATVVLMHPFDGELFLRTVRTYRITHLALVPPVLVMMAKNPAATRSDFASVKEVLCGAAPVPKDVNMKVRSKLGIKWVRNAYGMTELSVVITMSKRSEENFEAVGHLLPGAIVKTVNIETQETLGPYAVGEICVKGPHVMLEYYGNPKATRETIDEEGWLHTGDLGYYDEQGRLYVIDRLKELIKYKGFQVAPAELENVLLMHPAVKDAAVAGKPDEMSGELPMAFVVKQPNAKVTAKEIEQYVNERVSPQKQLRGGVRFLDAIPKNPSGKILRRDLRKLVAKL